MGQKEAQNPQTQNHPAVQTLRMRWPHTAMRWKGTVVKDVRPGVSGAMEGKSNLCLADQGGRR